MLRQMLSVTLFCAVSTAASATVDCAAIAALGQAFDAPETENSAGVTLGSPTTASPEMSQSLHDLATLTDRLAQIAASEDAATLRDALQSPDTAAIFRSASLNIAEIVCPTPPALRHEETPDSLRRFLSDLTVLQVASDNIHALPYLLAGSVVTAGIGSLIWVFLHRRDKIRRRAKRYPVNVPISYMFRGENLQGVLQDISGKGAKIKHNGEMAGYLQAKVVVVIAGRPETGRIVWVNDIDAGVQFDTPLRRSQVQNFVSYSQIAQKARSVQLQ